MSYLDLVILRVLAKEPAHGYAIRRQVEEILGGTVSLNPNVLYPALRRFEEAGAVEKTVEMQQGRPPRHVYQLLPLGQELFHDLLCEFGPDQARDVAEFQTRVAFFDVLAPAERARILDARENALAAQAQHVRSLGERGRDRWSKLVTQHVLDHIELERAWVRRVRDQPGEMKAGGGGRGQQQD